VSPEACLQKLPPQAWPSLALTVSGSPHFSFESPYLSFEYPDLSWSTSLCSCEYPDLAFCKIISTMFLPAASLHLVRITSQTIPPLSFNPVFWDSVPCRAPRFIPSSVGFPNPLWRVNLQAALVSASLSTPKQVPIQKVLPCTVHKVLFTVKPSAFCIRSSVFRIVSYLVKAPSRTPHPLMDQLVLPILMHQNRSKSARVL
jgi:hypothetical protein